MQQERRLERIASVNHTISYERSGRGAPLVLVHGSFSNHQTNWEPVRPLLENEFTFHAVARRGRGETDATEGHQLEDEARDVAAVVQAIGQPVFLLGHSYGAQVALAAAALVPEMTRKLVLYEPPWPDNLSAETLLQLEAFARRDDWDGFAARFFREMLSDEELDGLRQSDLWPAIVADAKPTLGDLRALSAYGFQHDRFRELGMPVMLQIGTESPRGLFVTDALARVLPDARIETLAGQGHEAMIAAPGQYARSLCGFFHD
jgi:pimeloyl-ACP methyl ester carboxylesterase